MITDIDSFCLRAQVLFDGKRESAGGLLPTILVAGDTAGGMEGARVCGTIGRTRRLR